MYKTKQKIFLTHSLSSQYMYHYRKRREGKFHAGRGTTKVIDKLQKWENTERKEKKPQEALQLIKIKDPYRININWLFTKKKYNFPKERKLRNIDSHRICVCESRHTEHFKNSIEDFTASGQVRVHFYKATTFCVCISKAENFCQL